MRRPARSCGHEPARPPATARYALARDAARHGQHAAHAVRMGRHVVACAGLRGASASPNWAVRDTPPSPRWRCPIPVAAARVPAKPHRNRAPTAMLQASSNATTPGTPSPSVTSDAPCAARSEVSGAPVTALPATGAAPMDAAPSSRYPWHRNAPRRHRMAQGA